MTEQPDRAAAERFGSREPSRRPRVCRGGQQRELGLVDRRDGFADRRDTTNRMRPPRRRRAAPKISNVRRQEIRSRTYATISGVNAPLQRAASHSMPCARSRSFTGSQVVKMRVRFGKQPASPAPNSARVTINDAAFHTQPVAAVKKRPPEHDPHQDTSRSDAVAEPAARDFEERIRPAEHRQGPSHLQAGQPEIVGHRWRCLRDADAIEVRNDCQHHRECGRDVPNARGMSGDELMRRLHRWRAILSQVLGLRQQSQRG